MALRARLVAPPPKPKQQWPWHKLAFTSIRASEMGRGDRRMAARTFLSGGYAVRRAIEAKRTGWVPFDELAEIQQPARTKAILVAPEFGVPFLIANQMFEARPRARKWLSIDQLKHPDRLYVPQGTILVRRSADVGRSMLTCEHHERHLISDHFFRIEPKSRADRGWLYAFVRSDHGRSMMTATQYGHIIQHIERGHLRTLPVPTVSADTAADFENRVHRILVLRNDASRLANEADSRFADAVGPIKPMQREEGFTIRASDLLVGRRRLEASYHTPQVASILQRFERFDRLRDVTERVWWMSRFARHYGEGGIPYLSADELFTVNPQQTKRILVDPGDNHRKFFVEPGWIVMACSGQVYGLNGAAALMTEHHTNTFLSHDLIRIIPDKSKIRAGYLLVALTHRTHGRPLLIRAAYGTSIPHLDPGDVADFPVVRLGAKIEEAIADLSESSVRARAEADVIERRLAADASALIDRFIAEGK